MNHLQSNLDSLDFMLCLTMCIYNICISSLFSFLHSFIDSLCYSFIHPIYSFKSYIMLLTYFCLLHIIILIYNLFIYFVIISFMQIKMLVPTKLVQVHETTLDM